jgi:4-hydroxybenzoate polyprenyltransferase
MKVLDFIFAARPLLHIPVWTVYLITLHHHRQADNGLFSIEDLVMLGCLSLLFAGAFYLNQVYDYDSDLRNKKLGFLLLTILAGV